MILCAQIQEMRTTKWSYNDKVLEILTAVFVNQFFFKVQCIKTTNNNSSKYSFKYSVMALGQLNYKYIFN